MNPYIRICKVEGCGREHTAKGYCTRHWNAVYRGGKDPETLHLTDRPGIDNPEGASDLTEHEFVLMKEFKDCGSRKITPVEVARELEKAVGVIREAWEFKTFIAYRDRRRVDLESIFGANPCGECGELGHNKRGCPLAMTV